MKKLFSCFAVICFALTASAQYQVENSDFESFLSNGEPNRWHGFKSATGNYASWAKGTLNSSTDVRPGTTGGKSAVITSGSVFGIVNNGTFTTGQLAAGSMSATNTANHAEMDKSSTATDKNGDKFYMPLTGHPDAVKVWIKFSQATPNAQHPYASANAVIFDGSYYQDPEDKAYTNKVAMAKNVTIATCNWTEFTIPFDYDSYKSNVGVTNYNNNGGGILVTFGTNATPGQGSSGDKVFVDDMVLVYNSELASVTYDGSNVTVASAMDLSSESYDESKLSLTHNAKGNAKIEKSYDEATGILTITVKGEDCVSDGLYGANLNNYHTYTIQFKQKVYECDLLTLTYDGVALPFSADDATEAFIDGTFDESKLAYTVSEDATVEVSFNEEYHILYIDVTAGDGKTAKSYEIQFYYKGDVNKDGTVSIADVTALVNMILGKTEKNELADVNADGDVSIADVTALVNIILGKN